MAYVMAHTWTSRTTHKIETWHLNWMLTFLCVFMPHTYIRTYVLLTRHIWNESWHSYEWVMAHLWMSPSSTINLVRHMSNESWLRRSTITHSYDEAPWRIPITKRHDSFLRQSAMTDSYDETPWLIPTTKRHDSFLRTIFCVSLSSRSHIVWVMDRVQIESRWDSCRPRRNISELWL